MGCSLSTIEEEPRPEANNGNLIAVIDKLIIEFDGTTLLCRVCGDRSSGFHYGVHSCEGCKGFFRRSIQQKIQYRPCSKNQICHVQKTNRNRCQYCRLKKCIEVGMSKDAVRFGRVPKNEKERIRQAMAKASSNCPQQDFNDDYLISVITKSHMETCSVARDNVKDILSRADESPRVASIDPLGNCPLNPYIGSEDFQQKFSPIVREVVTFAKNIPGFVDLKHEDKINLLRACVFEVLLIRFSALIDPKNKRMISISGSIIFTNIYSNIKASSDFVDTLFTFVDRINSLSLSDEEMALFTAAIVINPKRQGLSDLNKISCIHKRIVHCLHVVMQRERPNNPNLSHELISTLNDLWILNGMHSKQTQAKPRMNGMGDASMDIGTSMQFPEPSSKYFNSFSKFSDMQGCPVRCPASSSPEYEDKRMTTDDGLPTSPTSNYSQDEAMQSPGSADSGCSVDSGCSSAESDASYDSGCSVTSHSGDRSSRSHSMLPEGHREIISTEEELSDGYRNYHIKRKPNIVTDESRNESDKSRPLTWHKPQKDSEKAADSPVLRMCLEAPSSLKMDTFNDYYRGHGPSHPHKKFRPAMDRSTYSHETLDSCSSSPRPSTSPSPSFSSSPSPSSSISSSPSRISSSPYPSSSMSSPSSPGNISILAHRLAMPVKKFPKTSSLLQSLTQEPKFGNGKTLLSDTLHDCIMNGQSKVPRQHVMAAPSPSRYDDLRNISPMNSNMSPPHPMAVSPSLSHHNSSPYRYSSPPLLSNGHIPPAHSPPSHTPSGLGASAMGGCMSPETYMCDDAQPLNLSTKTPSPPPIMDA